MKKILILILIIFLTNSISYAIEEVKLPEEHLNLGYLSDIYYGKVSNQDEISPVIKLFTRDGLKFENSKINSVKMSFLYSGHLFYGSTEHTGRYLTHDFNTVEPMVIVNFNENKTKAMFDINLTRNLEGYSNWFTQRISQVYVSHQITPSQLLILGQYERLPNSYDGSRTVLGQEMIYKSQLGRTFGEARSVGLRNKGTYKYLDYDIGVYDSTRYMKDFGNGLDFTGYLMLKPFENISEQAGNFKIGSGYNIGHNNISYNMYSLYAGYDYDRFHIHAEYANANGYNGIKESKNDADGFYSLISYNITPKLTVLARYDVLDPDKHTANDNITEYTAGITYKIFKNMKIMLNYVRRNNENKPDSNLILFATRFII